MKIIIKIFCVLLCISPLILHAQTTPTSERSTETDVVKGTKVYVHTVKAGETTYSLCKLYNTSEKEVRQLNPGALIEGLAIGQKVLFPYSEPPSAPKNFTGRPTMHTVKKGETIYGISKQYNISISEILAANPSLTDGLKVGEELTIPAPEETVKSIKTESTDKKVVKQDALFPPQGKKADSLKSVAQARAKSLCDSLTERAKNKTTNIAIILPFYIKANDSLNSADEIIGKNSRLYGKSLPYIEFYEGVLLAVDSLKRKGYSMHLFSFDSSTDSLNIQSIISSLQSKNIDLIIGPVEQDDFSKFASFALSKHIPIISPLSTNTILTKKNPMVIMANTATKYRIQAEAVYAMSEKANRYVIIHAGHVKEIETIERIKDYLKLLYKDSAEMNKHVKTIKYNGYSMRSIENAMDTSKNIVIIPSEDQVFVNDMVTKLYNYKRRYRMELHGMSIWDTYKNLELDILFDLNLKIASSTFRDYENSAVKHFVLNFRDAYANEPSKLSFLGYDIMLHFGNMAALYGKNIFECGILKEYKGIQTSFNLQSTGKGNGFCNTSVNIIEYNAELKRSIVDFNVNTMLKKYESKVNSRSISEKNDSSKNQEKEEMNEDDD